MTGLVPVADEFPGMVASLLAITRASTEEIVDVPGVPLDEAGLERILYRCSQTVWYTHPYLSSKDTQLQCLFQKL